jgi:glycopeptide antibiotics resistance protein
MVISLKFTFYISLLFLAIISLWPGSLFGLFFYGDLERELNLIKNPYGSSINHFIYYFYVSVLGLFIYMKDKKFKKLLSGLFILSIIFELIHLIIPKRAFEIHDLLFNICGVAVAYFVINIYLFIKES